MKSTSVVLDPTVAVDALLRPTGSAGLLVRRFLARRDFELVVTDELLEQIRRAATDSKVLERLELASDEVDRWVAALGVLATVLPGAPPDRAEGASAGAQLDDAALTAAAAAGDAVIVSLDSELLSRTPGDGLEVVRPEVLLEVLEARDEAGLGAVRAV